MRIKNFFWLCLGISLTCFTTVVYGESCLSKLTVDITSETYRGVFKVGLRNGYRPGSRLISSKEMTGPGKVFFPGICPGNYFVSLAVPDSDYVDVTQYFLIKESETLEGVSYSDMMLQIFYSVSLDKGQRVDKIKRNSL
ncbi:MAG: hypothetical protein P8N92_07330 [Burkholderiales bacterium]|nr:hypothetical protein [Burkholderiales bacterium]